MKPDSDDYVGEDWMNETEEDFGDYDVDDEDLQHDVDSENSDYDQSARNSSNTRLLGPNRRTDHIEDDSDNDDEDDDCSRSSEPLDMTTTELNLDDDDAMETGEGEAELQQETTSSVGPDRSGTPVPHFLIVARFLETIQTERHRRFSSLNQRADARKGMAVHDVAPVNDICEDGDDQTTMVDFV